MRQESFVPRLVTGSALLLTFGLDRVLKTFFLNHPDFRRGFMVPGLSFHLEKNYGIAFGVPVPGTILMVLICAALVYLVYELIRAHARQASTLVAGLGMILTGTMSNLLDRAWPGYVIDYIDVRFFSVFNLADVLITLGVGIILLQSLRRRPIR